MKSGFRTIEAVKLLVAGVIAKSIGVRVGLVDCPAVRAASRGSLTDELS